MFNPELIVIASEKLANLHIHVFQLTVSIPLSIVLP